MEYDIEKLKKELKEELKEEMMNELKLKDTIYVRRQVSTVKIRKEYQDRRKQNLTEEEKRIQNQKCAERMRELRKLRKNMKVGK